MSGFLATALSAFGIVFVAELGDKTQLLAVNFGTQYSIRQVMAGLAWGYGVASLVAVVVGGVLGANLPQRPVEIVGGLIFIVFGVLSARTDDDEDAPSRVGGALVRSSVVATIGLGILVAEMGDKTQIATATLAARSNPFATWIGSTVGEVASGMIGVLAGSLVGDRIPDVAMRWLSSSLFVVFGLALLLGWP